MASVFAILSFSFFLMTHGLVAVDVPSSSNYEPTGSFFLDCSSSDLSSIVERMSSLNHSKADLYIVSKVYTTELPYFHEKPKPCLHKKHFTYTFPVSPGPKFVRLHFNPFSYSGFHASKAIFSVSANHYTLLKTSKNSYAECNSDGYDCYTVKEYCIHVDDDQVLNVTFIPSPDVSDAYAFVNKIEVVSMPSDLYIRDGAPLPLIGQTSPYYINNSRALEKMHRLNIGGDLIHAQGDTGMFRKWTSDTSFLTTEEGTGIVHAKIQMKHSSVVPPYVAPQQVYASARTVVSSSNGTKWSLPIDSGFHYLVRLHFCEISDEIRHAGQRVFLVSIKNQTAEDHADIFRWGHGAGIPVYKDYIVNFSEHCEGRKYLSLSIENINGSIKTYKSGILNGLEVFKLSDYSNSLAGQFSFGTIKSSRNDDGYDHHVKCVGYIILGMFFIFCMSGFLGLSYKVFVSDREWWRKVSTQSQSSDHCKSFSFDELKLATDNFSEGLLLGAGGFGKVYKGTINGDTNIVAIKRSNPCSNQGLNEFQTEIFLLSQFRHCHLVSLIGCCKEKEEMMIVYDYMANGTLRDHLYKTSKPPLSWKRRLAICIGAARGLHYLHTGGKHKIIHRDVKSTNILLDKDWVAKVSDFGLSKIGPNMLSQSNTHVSTMVKGSFGYLDPEYYRRQKLSEKSDVYSFGVVLFEVLCARPAVLQATGSTEEEYDKVNLAEWALHCYLSGTLGQIIDPYLQGQIDPTCLKTFTDIARRCLADKGSERPSMGEVLWNLEQAGIQQEDNNSVAVDTNRTGELPVILDLSGVELPNGGSDPTPGVEFSEIIVPIGR